MKNILLIIAAMIFMSCEKEPVAQVKAPTPASVPVSTSDSTIVSVPVGNGQSVVNVSTVKDFVKELSITADTFSLILYSGNPNPFLLFNTDSTRFFDDEGNALHSLDLNAYLTQNSSFGGNVCGQTAYDTISINNMNYNGVPLYDFVNLIRNNGPNLFRAAIGTVADCGVMLTRKVTTDVRVYKDGSQIIEWLDAPCTTYQDTLEAPKVREIKIYLASTE